MIDRRVVHGAFLGAPCFFGTLSIECVSRTRLVMYLTNRWAVRTTVGLQKRWSTARIFLCLIHGTRSKSEIFKGRRVVKIFPLKCASAQMMRTLCAQALKQIESKTKYLSKVMANKRVLSLLANFTSTCTRLQNMSVILHRVKEIFLPKSVAQTFPRVE